jgi:ribosomal protein S18 acetylase RimI-like enzyme
VADGVEVLLANPDRGFYLVAEQGGLVVGALMVTFEWSDWRNGLFWWIQSVYVRPESRRDGILSSLYQFVKSRAEKEPEVCGLRLYVEQENVGAQKAYDALGMTRTRYEMYEQLLGDG